MEHFSPHKPIVSALLIQEIYKPVIATETASLALQQYTTTTKEVCQEEIFLNHSKLFVPHSYSLF